MGNSAWEELLMGVLQGSVLGHLLFNINLNDICNEICNFADDTTPHSTHGDLNEAVKNVEHS